MSCQQSRSLLESIDNNFLVQVLDRPTRSEVLLCSPTWRRWQKRLRLEAVWAAMLWFMISRNTGLAKEGVRTLNLRRANFQLFNGLLDETHWETLLRDKGTDQSWQYFKDACLRAQELSILQNKQSGRQGRKPAWLCKDLLVRLKEKCGEV